MHKPLEGFGQNLCSTSCGGCLRNSYRALDHLDRQVESE